MKVDIEKYEREFIEDYENGDFERYLTTYRKKKIVNLVKKYKADNFLEIGCGMEPFFLVFENYKNMYVVEPGRRMATHASDLTEGRTNIKIINGFVEECVEYLKSFSYDFILLVGLIHEVEDADLLLESLYSLCSSDTKILVTTGNPCSFHLTLAYEAGIISEIGSLTDRAKKYQRNRVFSMDGMKELVKKHGFMIHEEGGYYIKPFSHYQMKQMVDLHIIDEKVLDGLDNIAKYMPELCAENYVIVSK